MKEITIELKSEPMNEMLSHPPSWIVRSGNSLFFILLLIAGLLSWIIEYPDEIEGEVVLTTIQPPIELTNQLYVQLKKIRLSSIALSLIDKEHRFDQEHMFRFSL